MKTLYLSSIISYEGVQSSFHECLSSCGNEDSEPSLMPSIISTFTPPLVASSAEEQCVVRSRTTTLYTVDSHGQISFSISESVSESDQLSNEDFSKLIGKRFRDDEDGRMCTFVSCLSSRVNIPKHFDFRSSELEWRCIL